MPISPYRSLAALAAVLPLSIPVFARSTVDEPKPPARPEFRIPLAPSPARIDGVLDDALWKTALVLELEYEIRPGENTPAPVATECLLAYDHDRLYVGFRAKDPEPGKIRAHLTDRDRAYRDDFVGIIVDPFNDERRGFEFFVNPLGVQMDLRFNEVGGGESEDDSWDAIWSSAGRIHEGGYDVEFAVPFASLRFPRGQGEMTWGIQPFRAYPRVDRHQLSAVPWDRNKNCYFCQVPRVTGFAGARPGRSLEISPTLTARRTDEREDFPAGDLESGKLKASPGVSVQWGLTPNLALNGTLNPDFSQVEADVAQLSVNRRFALFFPEKRSFFLEGADFFETMMPVVYTRAVADPDFGLKITGKEGKNAFGAILARDALTNILLPSNQGSSFASTPGRVLDALLRYRRDVGQGSTLGFLLTARDGEGYKNFLAGLDAHVRFGPRDTARLQLLASSTEYPEALAREHGQRLDRFAGKGGRLEYNHDSRGWSWWGGYVTKGRGLRADLGFLNQVDAKGGYAGFQRHVYPVRRSWYTRLSFGLEADHTDDQSGRLTDDSIRATWRYEGPQQMMWFGNAAAGREFFAGKEFSRQSLWWFFNIRPTGDFTSSLEFEYGDRVDYASARLGKLFYLAPGITFDPGRHLRLQLDHTFEDLRAEGARVYTANLIQLKAVWQFSTRAFVRGIVQFTNIDRNAANYREPVDPLSRHVFTQLLFSYKLNPQTLVHLGYSDNNLADSRLDLTRADRTFFLKLSYAWLP